MTRVFTETVIGIKHYMTEQLQWVWNATVQWVTHASSHSLVHESDFYNVQYELHPLMHTDHCITPIPDTMQTVSISTCHF